MSESILYYVLMVLVLILYIINSAVLILKGIKSKKDNLLYLGLSFALMVIIFVIFAVAPSSKGNASIYNIVVYILNLIAFLLVNQFTHASFYQDKKSPLLYIDLASFIIFIPIMILEFTKTNVSSEYYWNRIGDGIFQVLWFANSFGWMTFAAVKSNQNLKESGAPDWVINRMNIIALSALINVFNLVPDLLRKIFAPDSSFGSAETPWAAFATFTSAGLLLVFVILQMLVWVMPKGFKKLLNNGQEVQFSDESIDLDEEEIMRQMQEGEFNE